MNLKTDIYPLNYIKSIWTPLKAFGRRFELNWFTIVLTIIFLNALMIIPVTLNYAGMESFPLEEYYPNAAHMIDEQVVDELGHASINEGQLQFERPFYVQNEYGEVAGGLAEGEQEERIQSDNFMVFDKHQLIIGEDGLPTATILYTRDFSLAGLNSPEAVNQEVNRQWFHQNKVLIVLFFSLLIGVFLLFMTSFLIFGSAFLIYLTKKGKLTTIETYKESVNLILNSLGVPTILALVFGLFYFDVYLMVTIQSLGLIIYLFVIWAKVQFNDNQLEKITV